MAAWQHVAAFVIVNGGLGRNVGVVICTAMITVANAVRIRRGEMNITALDTVFLFLAVYYERRNRPMFQLESEAELKAMKIIIRGVTYSCIVLYFNVD